MKKNFLGQVPHFALIIAVLIMALSSCKSKQKLAQVTKPTEETEPLMEDQVEEEINDNDVPSTTQPVERKPEKILSKEQQLNNYLKAVSGATSVASANSSITEALTMFDTPEAPVLLVIYNDGANPDYDEPTTIEKYLNYLKDTKSKPAQVDEVVYTAAGKIKELVLKK